MTTASPGLRPLEMSPELAPPPSHTPERAGVPFARYGAGPDCGAGWRVLPAMIGSDVMRSAVGTWAWAWDTSPAIDDRLAPIRMLAMRCFFNLLSVYLS